MMCAFVPYQLLSAFYKPHWHNNAFVSKIYLNSAIAMSFILASSFSLTTVTG
jgi:hypothetical protein